MADEDRYPLSTLAVLNELSYVTSLRARKAAMSTGQRWLQFRTAIGPGGGEPGNTQRLRLDVLEWLAMLNLFGFLYDTDQVPGVIPESVDRDITLIAGKRDEFSFLFQRGWFGLVQDLMTRSYKSSPAHDPTGLKYITESQVPAKIAHSVAGSARSSPLWNFAENLCNEPDFLPALAEEFEAAATDPKLRQAFPPSKVEGLVQWLELAESLNEVFAEVKGTALERVMQPTAQAVSPWFSALDESRRNGMATLLRVLAAHAIISEQQVDRILDLSAEMYGNLFVTA